MNHQETFDKGVEYRLQGNEAFKKGEYQQALRSYYHAILHLRTVGGNEKKDEFKEASEKQLVTIYNNMSAVYSKQDKWDRVLEYSQKAHSLDSSNIKTKFRLAQAYLRRGDVDRAKPLLESCLENNPNDGLVKQEMAQLKKLEQSQEAKEKSVYRNMFAKLQTDK
ncbi:uncharacterized protein BYT42DRAFT_550790 [Radiomyces spectabilis]|uniref:uncharacterized protein n=1 Tax=Radiomyces spectabilis TaxID=64574 RepID=UPI00221E558A|nr:uncharacterized protein BYT42DRAFT_550790 [Radiomyces spectabilis]KAI8393369.1 hypothetical protein BYT42DRAFT_550790 [Radiomyces spectabilis]